LVWRSTARRASSRSCYPRPVWPAGRQNVRVTYEYGYATVDFPRDVRAVALSIAARLMVQGVAKSETVGETSITYASASTDLTNGEKAILAKYRPSALMPLSTFLNGRPPTRGLTWLALSATATIFSRTFASDSGGGGSATWVTAGTVACRIDPLTAYSRITAGAIDERSTHIVTIPPGTIDVQNRVVIAARHLRGHRRARAHQASCRPSRSCTVE
jgi:hypothetical protein